jgi:hypothetical protein
MLQSGSAPKNAGWGIGTTTPAVTDTALESEAQPTVSGGRTVGVESQTTTTVPNDTYTVTATITQNQAGPVAITEYGQFDNITAGAMLLHAVFAQINTYNGDSIAFTSHLKIAASGP